MTKKLKKIENKLDSLGIIIFILLILLLIGNVITTHQISLDMENYYNKLLEKENLKIENLTTQLNQIEKNCNSTFFTKKYNDDNWYIFVIEYGENYETTNMEYILLEDCLEK